MKNYHGREADCVRAFSECRPRTLQANVRLIDDFTNAGRYGVRLDGAMLSAILEVECVDDKLWLHLSICGQKPARVPDWTELRWCKDYFLGVDRKAVQILPARAEYINQHPNVLHLYSPLEGDPLPDFRGIDATGNVGI